MKTIPNPSQTSAICVLASFPPPVYGQCIVTARIVEELRARCTVDVYDWLPNQPFYNRAGRIAKCFVSLAALFWLVRRRFAGRSMLYTVANAGHGMVYNLLAVAVARSLGFRCVLHHHAISYLQQRNLTLKLIDRLMGRDGVHVVLGPEMEHELREQYGSRCMVLVVSNGFILGDPPPSPRIGQVPCPAPSRLGHISNLNLTKGLDLVLETFERLRRDNYDVQLVLAGPIASDEARELIRAARQQHGRRFDYRGPVYDADKEQFYRDIDILLFPTRDDAQPLVIVESFADGKPVIATGRGCIPSLTGSAGHVVDDEHAYVQYATKIIEDWIDEPNGYKTAVARANSRAGEFYRESRRQLEVLIQLLVTGSFEEDGVRDENNLELDQSVACATVEQAT